MKVVVIANSKHVKGGITSVVNSLIAGLSSKDSGICIKRHSSYIDSVSPFMRIIYSLLAIGKILFVIPFHSICHLHSAANGSFYRKSIYTYLCKAFNKKVIFHIHGSSFEEFHNSKAFHAWLIRKTLNRADGIIVLSEQMKSLVLSYCENQNIWILPNPVQMPSNNEIGSTIGSNENVQLLFMGEIGKRKGIYDLVSALALLPSEIKDKVTLHICGNNEIEKLKAYIEEKKVGDMCKVHGWIDGEKKKALLQSADIYILPSYQEGLPVSILEAMAYRLPIISTNVGGIPEIVLNDENGFIINPGSVDDLADSISKLVVNHELRLSFGKRSAELVRPHDIDVVIEQLFQIYKNI